MKMLFRISLVLGLIIGLSILSLPAYAAAPAANTAPVITTQPVPQTVYAGDPVTFTAAASGSPTPTVQWYTSIDKGLTYAPIGGATSNSYTFYTHY